MFPQIFPAATRGLTANQISGLREDIRRDSELRTASPFENSNTGRDGNWNYWQNRGVPDHLYYSCWLRGFSAISMLRQYGKALELFPFSPQNPADSILRVQAISTAEPFLAERAFLDPIDPKAVAAEAAEFLHDDCAYSFETWWGLWTYEKDWQLAPARVTIHCFGPRFSDSPVGDDEQQAEHLRVDFGLESWFLPQAELPNAAWYARSNLKGLLKYVHSLDEALPVERRALWTESGGNFAERLREAAEDL